MKFLVLVVAVLTSAVVVTPTVSQSGNDAKAATIAVSA